MAAAVFPIVGSFQTLVVRNKDFDYTTVYQSQGEEYPLVKYCFESRPFIRYRRKNREIRRRLDKAVEQIMRYPTRGKDKTQKHPGSIVPPILERIKNERGIPNKTDRWYEQRLGGDLRVAYITNPQTWGLSENDLKGQTIEGIKEGFTPTLEVYFVAIGPHQDITGKKYNAENAN